jgi:hypothetical protein
LNQTIDQMSVKGVEDQVNPNAEDRESRTALRKLRIAQAEARLRKFAIPGKLMSDELIAERREEARRE